MSIICGIVLYNPDLDRLQENIEAIIHQVDKIICFDNNSQNIIEIKQLLIKYKKVEIICASKNEGIAYALNKIAEKSVQYGYKWLLTLDQDSVVNSNLISVYKNYFNLPSIGQLTCEIVERNIPLKEQQLKNDYSVKKVRKCITSGSLINLKAWRLVNGFDNSLFIDWVDTEFCFKLQQKGFFNYKIEFRGILHEIGKISQTHFLFWNINTSNHTAFRRYYMARNDLFVSRKYSKYQSISETMLRQLKEEVKIVLFEKNKIKKTKAWIKGLIDGFKKEI